ncbi:MAG: DUF333 domain-containing protein [Patescibacteria group bacterium]|nr:DUF333 domain-containing protein [Patescibacteria group bacterium]
MKKTLVLFTLLLISANISFAQTKTSAAALNVQSIQQEENIGVADLNAGNLGILPTNPFYFLKEIGRNIQLALTFDPLAKAELQLKIANETAAEAKKIQEIVPNDNSAIVRGIRNYQAEQEKLSSMLESLNIASSTPGIDQLIGSIASSTVLHQKVLNEIASDDSDSKEVVSAINSAKKAIDDSAAIVASSSPAIFAKKMQSALDLSKGSVLKNVRSLEIISDLITKVPAEAQKALLQVQQNIGSKLSKTIQSVSDTVGSTIAKQMLEAIPFGDPVQKSAIIDQLQKNLMPLRVSSTTVKLLPTAASSTVISNDIASATVQQISDNLVIPQSQIAAPTVVVDCGKENEKVNRDPLIGPVNKPCCYGLKENRSNIGYSVCVKPENIEGDSDASNISSEVATSTLIGIANPAAVYCIDQGFEEKIMNDQNGGQYGVCIFSDGSSCDEWAYYRGECKPTTASSTINVAPVDQQKNSVAGAAASSTPGASDIR